MSHALAKVYVHFVWTTWKRQRLLLGEARQLAKQHIEQNAANKQILILAAAVQPEHVHALIQMSRSQCIDDVVKLLKGESSHWINQNNLIRPKFSWQTGYWGGSVCYQHLDRVKAYIENQDDHHPAKPFQEEFELLLREEGYTESEVARLLGE